MARFSEVTVLPSPAVELVINNTWGGHGAVERTTEVSKVRKDSATADVGWLKRASPWVEAGLPLFPGPAALGRRCELRASGTTANAGAFANLSASSTLLMDVSTASLTKASARPRTNPNHQSDEDVEELLRTNRRPREVLPGQSHEYSSRADPPKPSHP